jgi:ferric-dicitrate binding protein FerR (iron transport regulator)
MTNEEMHIEQLMMERLSGVITEADNRFLDEVIAHDRAARERWEGIRHAKATVSLNASGMIDEERAWQQVSERIARKRRDRWSANMRRMAIAASFMVPLIMAAIFFHYRTTPESVVATNQPSETGVKLLVGGHQAVNLSDQSLNTISPIGNVQLQLGHGSLSYKALNNEVSHTLNTLVVPATLSYTITLSDGTEVSLNSMTALKFAFTFAADKREVWLNGEAFFQVAKDDSRPFVVHTPLTDIKVLGTSFNVNTYDSFEVKTSLVEGAVRAESAQGKDQVLLKPGYEAVFSPHAGFAVHSFDANNVLSWMSGVYYFEHAALSSIGPVISRWYGDSLIFDDPRAAASRFSGAMIKEKNLKEFLDNLTLTSNIQVRYANGGKEIHLSLPE